MDIEKMDLRFEAVKYIQHKVTLSRVSKWYASKSSSIMVCDSLSRLLQTFKNANVGSKQIAKSILEHKRALFDILPNPNNKSYESSFRKYNEIIDYCNQLLKPKQHEKIEGIF